MDALKGFATLLLFVSAACCIYYFLLPAGNVAKTAKKLLSAFFLACAVLPLFSLLRQDRLWEPASSPEETQTAASNEERFAEAGEQVIRRAAARVLDAGTDVPYELFIETHIGEDMCIDIQQVTVLFARDFAGRTALIARLTQTLGAPVRSEVKNAAGADKEPVDENQNG